VKGHYGGPKLVVESSFLKARSNDFSIKTSKWVKT
jgi:hypothetical protein